MNKILKNLIFAFVSFLMAGHVFGQTQNAWIKLREIAIMPYPDSSIRVASLGHTSYFVNPTTGNDQNKGTKATEAWKTFANVNALKFVSGDKIVIAPGIQEQTL